MTEIVTRQEAMARGLTRYFTGRSCKRGHVAEYWVSGGCVLCVLENGRNSRRKALAVDPEGFRERASKRSRKSYAARKALNVQRVRLLECLRQRSGTPGL